MSATSRRDKALERAGDAWVEASDMHTAERFQYAVSEAMDAYDREPVDITDEMVDRAWESYSETTEEGRLIMRRALEAAFDYDEEGF